MSEALLEAVRGLRVADPDLGFKPLLAKLRAQQPELGAATKEVREAVNALKAESEAKAAVTPPAADEGGAPSNLALSLACIGCSRLPSDMDNEREKHPVCHKCRKQKLLTTYWCGIDCPGNPGAWKLHSVFHKEVKKYGQLREDGGVCQQQTREVAEEVTRRAAQTGDKYLGLLAEGARYASKDDWRRAAKAFREVIALRPDEPYAYTNLGTTLNNSGHFVEAAQRFLDAKERFPVDSEGWAQATSAAFDMLKMKECSEVVKPEWWNDEGLKALSARVVGAAPNLVETNMMRAVVLSGHCAYNAWVVGAPSAAELKEAAKRFKRAAALSDARAMKGLFADLANQCRSEAEGM